VNRRINKVISVFAAVILASFMIMFVSCNNAQQNAVAEHDVETPTLYDKQVKYVFDEKQDLQMPELPTGCEATALGTLLRMNGVSVTKFDVADAMPKSDGSDFVYSFWGNPYSATDGWACMAPCSVITANKFLKNSNKVAVEYTGTELTDLKFPSAVWVTMYLNNPLPSNYESNGYRLFRNPHCVVVTRIELDSVYVIDPLVGEVAYPLERFNNVYKELGCQAVRIETEEK
jgi:uncharacterized protein YvpB